jgi:hypothetical protein
MSKGSKVRRLAQVVLLLFMVLGVTDVSARASKKDLALTQELTHGTQSVLRVIVRTRPHPQALKRVTSVLKGLMAAAGVAGQPQVHDQLFAITAQVARHRIAQLESDPDVLQISADAVVQSLALTPTDAAWAQLIGQRDLVRNELEGAKRAVNDHYNPRIDSMSARAAERRRATEGLSAQRAKDADARLAQRQAAADARAVAAATRRAELDAAADARLADASARQAQRETAAAQRKVDAAARRTARETAAGARAATATAARKEAENAAAVRVDRRRARRARSRHRECRGRCADRRCVR